MKVARRFAKWARRFAEWARQIAEWARRFVEWARPFVERAWRFVKNSAVAVGEAVWDFLVQVARGVWYLCLFLSSIISHVLLLVLTVIPAVLPILVVWVLFERWDAFIDRIRPIGQKPIVQALAFTIVGAGLLGGIVMQIWKSAYDAVYKLWKEPAKVLRKGLKRGAALKGQPLGRGSDNIAKIPRSFGKAFVRVLLFTGSLLVSMFLIAIAYPFFARPVQTVDRYVAVVDMKDIGPETSKEIKLYMSTGAVFSLAYVDDAQPSNGEGICLGEPQQDWLREFRAAIANCMEEKKKTTGESPETDDTRFEVTGYASIALMHVDGDTRLSAELNCKVANWRAAAVGAFLADPDAEELKKRWSCQHMGDSFNDSPIECGVLTKKPYEGIDPQGNRFLVDVHQWSEPDRMVEEKPADDGTMPNRRRFDVEILNRVVHIKVPTDFCGDGSREASAP